MPLELKQNATPSSDRPGFWHWEVWLDGPASELDSVNAVTYRLHPTFPKPVRKVASRKSKFKITSSGWGEFLISAKVQYIEGEKKELSHWLKLSEMTASGRMELPRLFVSYNLSDTGVAQNVIEELRTSGFDVTDAYDVKAESSLLPWQEEVANRLKSSDAVLNFVGESSSSNTEAQVAESIGRTVLNVILPGSEDVTYAKSSSSSSVLVEDNLQAGTTVLNALKIMDT